MPVWEDLIPQLKQGAKLIKKRRAEPAWELLQGEEVIDLVYNNTVTALFCRGLVAYVLREDWIEAVYVP